MASKTVAERRREAEEQMLDLYVRLLYRQQPDASEEESGALAAPCPPCCGGRLMFHRPVLVCTRCGGRVAV